MHRKPDDLMREGRDALRLMVRSLGGDVRAFERDPMTFQETLDDFVSRIPPADMTEDERVWLHAQLANFLAEVLICRCGGRWEPAASRSAVGGYVVAVPGRDGVVRRVDPFRVVDQELHPVPQRIPRMLERALQAASV